MEDGESKQLYFIYNDSIIISLTEVVDPQRGYLFVTIPIFLGSLARLVVRNSVGKYCWESQIQYESSTKSEKAKSPVTLESHPGPSTATADKG